MIIVVFFNPATGAIVECSAGPPAWIEDDGRPFIIVDHFRPDWDITHRVIDGALIAIEEA